MKNEKEITINELANKMEQGFKVLDTKIDTKIDDLAASVANYSIDTQKRFNKIDRHFDDVDKRFDQMDKKIEDETRSVKAEISLGISELKEEIKRLDERIDRLLKMTTGDVTVLIEEQEKIKLRLKKLELKNSQI